MGREIVLSQGKVALVDDEDYERISRSKWYARQDPRSGRFYAFRNDRSCDPVNVVGMHREVIGAKQGERVDHNVARYVNEVTFRLNAGNVANHTLDRLDSFIRAVDGQRLTYKRLTA